MSTLSNLTSNGVVTTCGGTGALSVTSTTGSGSVVLATSPTLITPNLGTPASGDASNLINLNATQLTSGTVPVARLASSGTASSTTYLNGLGQWTTPSGGGTANTGAAPTGVNFTMSEANFTPNSAEYKSPVTSNAAAAVGALTSLPMPATCTPTFTAYSLAGVAVTFTVTTVSGGNSSTTFSAGSAVSGATCTTSASTGTPTTCTASASTTVAAGTLLSFYITSGTGIGPIGLLHRV